MSFQESHGRQIHDQSLECSRNFRLSGKYYRIVEDSQESFFPTLPYYLTDKAILLPGKVYHLTNLLRTQKHIRIQIIIISDLYHAFPIRKCRVSLIQTLIISLVIIIHVFQIYFRLKTGVSIETRQIPIPLFRQSHAKMFIQQIDIGSNR